jgi:Domain of unknown function (DUF5753)
VSRLENGRQTATTADVRQWAAALGLSPATCAELVEDLRSLRVEYATWRRQLRSGFASRQRVGYVLDDGVTALRAMQTAVVPGLLQTEPYARAIFRGLAELHRKGDVDIDAAVRERIRRQELLYQPGREFRFLLTESAVRARVGAPSVQRAQLDRLLVVASLDTVRLGVLPSSVETLTPPDHSFDIFDERLVLVETINAELAIRDVEDVALYAQLFEHYWAAAAHDQQAATLITRVAGELPAC